MATVTTKRRRSPPKLKRDRRPKLHIVTDPADAAKAAQLRYVTDTKPGIRRVARGKKFSYVDASGKTVRDPYILARIRSLAIPPAWTDVWVCPHAEGHLQATGRDARGRKQYRYHPRWRAVRDETKYTRMILFGRLLPQIRERVEQDFSTPGLSRNKVLATVVRLLETTLIRVGNEEYAKSNCSFGLTTMQDKHVDVNGSSVHFQFRGKSGVRHEIGIKDRRLAKIVSRCRGLPGEELFQYLDDEGNVQDIGSQDVNDYLREISGEEFTAKDFRTWAGTVLAALALQEFEQFDSQTQAKKQLVRAIESVAERLGNTPSVCRKCYVHPAIIEAFMDGTMLETLRQRAEQTLSGELDKLQPQEAAVLGLLQQRLSREVSLQKKGA